ncbi:MAG TPA: IPT/TIG domain-containing protein, partial [Bryobacteraceae bacterium]
TVTAINPGNNVSGPSTFTITAPAPAVISSLSKTSVTAGDAAFTVTITGTGFLSSAVVNFGSTALATTFVSATQLTAAVPANLLMTPNTTVQVTVAQAGTTSNGIAFTVNLPAAPTLRLNPPTGTGAAQQPTIDFGLNSPYPIPLSGTVTLTFASNATVPVDDPSIQFASGGRTFSFSVPANTTTFPALQLSTGTVAGTITLTVTLTAAGVNVTPSSGATATIVIGKTAPVILSGKVKLVHANGYLEVDVTGFSTTRDMTQAVFQLNAAPGGSFTSSTITVPISTIFTTWYQSAASATFGGQFTYTQPFTVIGDTNQVQSVTVTMTNSAGTSISMTSN